MAGSFMRLGADGQQVRGTSTDPAHDGWFDLTSVSMMSSGSGKQTPKDVTVTRLSDAASIALFSAAASGRVFTSAVIEMGDGQFSLAMTDVAIASLQVGSSHGPGLSPSESMTLSFASARYATR
ncbi:MAG: hypothetical protein GC186_06720 [Rhodobacteraceae bacterium]|nr:hypothetical protein [Paracoccaceae bacterium]